jgi:hypothetical protein
MQIGSSLSFGREEVKITFQRSSLLDSQINTNFLSVNTSQPLRGGIYKYIVAKRLVTPAAMHFRFTTLHEDDISLFFLRSNHPLWVQSIDDNNVNFVLPFIQIH